MNAYVYLIRRKFFAQGKWDHISAIIYLAVPLIASLTIIALMISDSTGSSNFVQFIKTTLIEIWPLSLAAAILNIVVFLLTAHCMSKAIELGPVNESI